MATAGRRPDAQKGQHRLTVRLSDTDFDRLKYWADKGGYDMNSFISAMLDLYVDIQNGNYQLPVLEGQRLNQLVELCQILSQNVHSLESVVVAGFEGLTQMTKGDYLFEDDEVGV